MILGCDVTHPNPGSKSASMAAVCGTTDATASDYKVEIRLQDQRVEVIQRMGEMVRALLENWKANPVNGGKGPDKIVCYRDGISDGEFHQVVETEIAAIRRAFSELGLFVPLALAPPHLLTRNA
jgi:eukaryotic translation initiation factor 2C